MTSEQAARQTIDELLSAAGWGTQDASRAEPTRAFVGNPTASAISYSVGAGLICRRLYKTSTY